MTDQHRIANEVRQQLEARLDPDRTEQQRAYMKSEMPYAGVPAAELKKLCRETFKSLPPQDRDDWLGLADNLWRGAIYREERYAAIELLAVARFQKSWHDPACLPQLKTMIQSGAWWDYVDALAVHHVGPLLKRFESDIKPVLSDWIEDEDLWVRRSAILAQLKFKDDTDLEFLDRAIQGSITDNDFFARKAIGWALRELSKTNPAWVVDYVEQHQSRLSGLSVREALKIIKKQSSKK